MLDLPARDKSELLRKAGYGMTSIPSEEAWVIISRDLIIRVIAPRGVLGALALSSPGTFICVDIVVQSKAFAW